MEKSTKKRYLILLAFVMVVCLFFGFGAVRTARAASVEDTGQSLQTAIDAADITITDGAKVSLMTPYVLGWEVNISEQTITNIASAAQAHHQALDDLVGWTRDRSGRSVTYNLLVFEEADVPFLTAGLSGCNVGDSTGWIEKIWHTFDGNLYFKRPESQYALNYKQGDTVYSAAPKFIIPLDATAGRRTVSITTGAENKSTNYVPIVFIDVHVGAKRVFEDPFGYSYQGLIYNNKCHRSVTYVANAYMQMMEEEGYWEKTDEEIMAEYAVMMQNVQGGQALEELEESDTLTQLQTAYPLNFAIRAGATFVPEYQALKWTCTFNTESFANWKNTVSKISLWWIVLKADDYISNGTLAENFKFNYESAIRVYPEHQYRTDGTTGNYISDITYIPGEGNEETSYIAIPFIKIVGISAPVASEFSLSYKDVASGCYVLCENVDNARSVAEFTAEDPDTVYTYTFEYLEAMEDRPFAVRKTKTITRDERLDYNEMTMEDYAAIIGAKTNSNGEIECLLSKINYWGWSQHADGVTYGIHAMYTLIPLTFRNDRGDTQVQFLGLIPFTNIDGTNEYAKTLTSLTDKNGKSYFNSLYEVEASDLYGYFYTYSYASEYANPNWQLSPDSYNGYLSYFTECTHSEYRRGYMEIGTYGSLGGAIVGAIIGTIVAPGTGTLVGAAIGAGAGGILTATVASLFGCQQDSTTTYYYVEYGFLDCTTMTPNGFYKTLEDPKMTELEMIIFALAIFLELFVIEWAWLKFKRVPWWLQLVLFVAVVGLLVFADVMLYTFFLNG